MKGKSRLVAQLCTTCGGHCHWMHQYSHNFLVGACTGLYKPVQALKVESLPEKQAMSDFPQVWFHFAQQALIGSLRIIHMIESSFIYFLSMAQDRERAFICCCCC